MDRGEELRALHEQRPLVLPNVWDAASARTFAAAGFPALATSSGAVAEVLGFEDHEATPPEEMFAAIDRITRAVDVPVSADVESGYGLGPDELVERLLAAGAAGANLEDSDHAGGGIRPATEQAERLAAVVAASAGRLVVNARVDSFVRGLDDPVDDAVARATRYLEAGADCSYPIGYLDEATVAELVERIPGPVNVLAARPEPSLARLGELGVARITFGSSLFRRASTAVTDLAEELAR